MKQQSSGFKSFILVALISLLATIFLSYHSVIVLFGDNSLQVYNSLKYKKEYLEEEILRLQKENAYLQKEYFELKNLEPEE
jgi:uncharacterized protein YlxW (UPF0749 family)